MADNNDPAFNFGCIGVVIFVLIAVIATTWEKSPTLVVLLFFFVLIGYAVFVYYSKVNHESSISKAKENLDNYVSYDSLLAEEELRARRLENDMKEVQIQLTYLEQENRDADRSDSARMKEIDRKMKKEELKLMRVKSEYEELKNTIRKMKDDKEI